MRCSPCIDPLRGEQKSQPFPTSGVLKNSSNIELRTLCDELSGQQGTVYLYVVDTVESNGEHFVQTGSAPNFQGGVITLCTCKHWMRTFMDADDWERNKWIAGFSNMKAGGNRNDLVYLMKIGHAFTSHFDLWYSIDVSEGTKQAKSARRDRFGDLFQPRKKSIERFNPEDYFPPTSNHVHKKPSRWHGDICYKGCSGRRSSLLVGDPNLSFVWNSPLLYLQTKLYRGQKKLKLREMLAQLRDEG